LKEHSEFSEEIEKLVRQKLNLVPGGEEEAKDDKKGDAKGAEKANGKAAAKNGAAEPAASKK
ncbi:MAG: hypothetical protein AAFP70_13005, partial [Calditrichota bacterium]